MGKVNVIYSSDSLVVIKLGTLSKWDDFAGIDEYIKQGFTIKAFPFSNSAGSTTSYHVVLERSQQNTPK